MASSFTIASANTACAWEALRNRALTLAEKQQVREFYNGNYHHRSEYTSRQPWHLAIAEHRVKLTQAMFPDLGRVLDAGCAAGEEVLEFRRQGVEAFGFDICPDLHDVAYPEVREFLRMGRMDHMPYSPADGFKTLVSFDVMEHVPIDSLQRMPEELVRLGITQVSCIISNDTISEGHITIQDTAYYVDLFRRSGFRLLTELTAALNQVLVPASWNEAAQRPTYVSYTESGKPRNGWNQVPGHLFFERL